MIDSELRAYLLADATLSNLLGSNAVYPVKLPQGHAEPCIVYSVHDGMAKVNPGSVSPIQRYNVTLHVRASDYGTARTICERVRTLVTGMCRTLTTVKVVSARVNNVFADYENEREHFTAIIDISINTRN